MKTLSVLLAAFLISVSSLAQTWKFVGPDSLSWRSAVQMDVQFRQGAQPRIAVATTKGITQHSQGRWAYVFRDQTGIPFMSDDFFRSAYYSPFNDSVAFVGVDFIEPALREPGSAGTVVWDTFVDTWSMGRSVGFGGFIGHSPSLVFVMSSHGTRKIYTFIVDFGRSRDNGLNWDILSPNSYGCYFLAADTHRDSVLYAGRRTFSHVQGVFRSTDDGTTWTNIYPFTFSMPYPHPYADFFANGDSLIWSLSQFPFTADSLCGIQVSVDRGETWTYVLRNINVQKFVRDENRRNVFYAAAEGGIYRSTNSGMSWALLFSNVPSPKLVDIRKDPYSDTLYVATRDSGVYKVADRTLEVIVREPLPTRFMLHQNYPNPSNPITNIKFQIPSAKVGFGPDKVGTDLGFVTLKVYDILGREVATLVNEEKLPGTYDVTFDAGNLASGVYLYRLSSGGLISTKRMVLLK